MVNALLRMAEHSAALFKHHRWPTLINYRIAYGLATGSWGGKTVEAMHAHCLGVADWVTCAEELFDDYVPPSEPKIEGDRSSRWICRGGPGRPATVSG